MNQLTLAGLAVTDVTHAMQLALGPVFLLNGIGVLLAMLTSRLARIVDRARNLETRLPHAGPDEVSDIHRVLRLTSRRARLMNRAITLGTVSALLVALVVALLFTGAFVSFPMAQVIAVLFVTSMGTLVGSLWCFLVEVRVSTLGLRFGPQKSDRLRVWPWMVGCAALVRNSVTQCRFRALRPPS